MMYKNSTMNETDAKVEIVRPNACKIVNAIRCMSEGGSSDDKRMMEWRK